MRPLLIIILGITALVGIVPVDTISTESLNINTSGPSGLATDETRLTIKGGISLQKVTETDPHGPAYGEGVAGIELRETGEAIGVALVERVPAWLLESRDNTTGAIRWIMQAQNNRNVGIGQESTQSDPSVQYKFDVQGVGAPDTSILAGDVRIVSGIRSSPNRDKGLLFGFSDAAQYGDILCQGSSCGIRLSTHNNTDGWQSRLVIGSATGYIGIGTDSPTSKLQVVGLPVYANNAAAVSGGLTAGAFYRITGSDYLAVVH